MENQLQSYLTIERSEFCIEHLELSITPESNFDDELHLFILQVLKKIKLRSVLWRANAVIQETFRHIKYYSKKESDKRNIKIAIEECSGDVIKIIVLCERLYNNETPLPLDFIDLCRKRFCWHIVSLSSGIDFYNGTRIDMYFLRY